MFFHQEYLTKKSGKFHLAWSVCNVKTIKPALRRKLQGVNLRALCSELLLHVPRPMTDPTQPMKIKFSLYLCAQLMYGIVVIYKNQIDVLYEEAKSWKGRLKGDRHKRIAIDLDPDVDGHDLNLSLPHALPPLREFHESQLSVNYRFSSLSYGSADEPFQQPSDMLTNPFALHTAPLDQITMREPELGPPEQLLEEDIFGGATFLEHAGELLGLTADKQRLVDEVGAADAVQHLQTQKQTQRNVRGANDTINGLQPLANRSDETPVVAKNGTATEPPPVQRSGPPPVYMADVTAMEEQHPQEPVAQQDEERPASVDVFRLENINEAEIVAKPKRVRAKRRINTSHLIIDEVTELTNDEIKENHDNYGLNLNTMKDIAAPAPYMFLTPMHIDSGRKYRVKMPHLFNMVDSARLMDWDTNRATELNEMFEDFTELDVVERDTEERWAFFNESSQSDQALKAQLESTDIDETRAQLQDQTHHFEAEQVPEQEEVAPPQKRRRTRVTRSMTPTRESVEVKRQRSSSVAPQDAYSRRASSLLPADQNEDAGREGRASRAADVLGVLQEEGTGVTTNGTVGHETMQKSIPQARKSYISASPLSYSFRADALFQHIESEAEERGILYFDDICPPEETTTVQAAKKFTLLLDLLKQRKVDVQQDEAYGPIEIKVIV